MNSKKLYKLLHEAVKKQLVEIQERDVNQLERYLKYKTIESDQLETIFEGKNRIVIPFKNEEIGAEDIRKFNTRDIYMYSYIQKLRQDGWTVDLTEPFGYASKIVNSEYGGKTFETKRKVKIGPLISAISPEAAEFWTKENKFYTTKANEFYFSKGYSIILSRVPVDILRMSDHDGWTSCHAPAGGYFKCAYEEAVEGGAIAYVVNQKDIKELDINNPEIFADLERNVGGISPISRVRIRRFINKKEGLEIALPEKRIYGQNMPGFYQKVAEFLYSKEKNEIQSVKDLLKNEFAYFNLDDWQNTGGTYEDNSGWELFSEFFGVELPLTGSTKKATPNLADRDLKAIVEDRVRDANLRSGQAEFKAEVGDNSEIFCSADVVLQLPKIINIKGKLAMPLEDVYTLIAAQMDARHFAFRNCTLKDVTIDAKEGITYFTFTLRMGTERNLEAFEEFIQNILYLEQDIYTLKVKLRESLFALRILPDELQEAFKKGNFKNFKVVLLDVNTLDGSFEIEIGDVLPPDRFERALSNFSGDSKILAKTYLNPNLIDGLNRLSIYNNWDKKDRDLLNYTIKLMNSFEQHFGYESDGLSKGQQPLFEQLHLGPYEKKRAEMIKKYGSAITYQIASQYVQGTDKVRVKVAFTIFYNRGDDEKLDSIIALLTFLDRNFQKIKSDVLGIINQRVEEVIEDLQKKVEETENRKHYWPDHLPGYVPRIGQTYLDINAKGQSQDPDPFPWRREQRAAEEKATRRAEMNDLRKGLSENKKIFNLDGATWRISK